MSNSSSAATLAAPFGISLHPRVPALEPIPPIDSSLMLPAIFGNGALFRFGVQGGDLDKLFQFLQDKAKISPDNAGIQLDLALVHLLQRRPAEAYEVQKKALEHQQLFRVLGTAGRPTPARQRVLALVAPGDFTNNAQLEFILDGADIGLDVLYIVPGRPLPAALPEHDVAFCAVNESDENRPVLERLAELLPRWPRPVINAPENILELSRNGVASLLQGAKDICAPEASRVTLAKLRAIGKGTVALDSVLPGFSYPILVRPVGSHGGKNLAKVDDTNALAGYVAGLDGPSGDFYVTPFVDYRGPHGLFRKYRLAFFEGEAFLCHMAVSDKWMIHYVNVGMAENAAKRAQEERAMQTFEDDFARRHSDAFKELHRRLALDFFILDCAELSDGRLLVFEADIAMVIHSMDSPVIFPYKQAQMARVFAAFCAMIDRVSRRGNGLQSCGLS